MENYDLHISLDEHILHLRIVFSIFPVKILASVSKYLFHLFPLKPLTTPWFNRKWMCIVTAALSPAIKNVRAHAFVTCGTPTRARAREKMENAFSCAGDSVNTLIFIIFCFALFSGIPGREMPMRVCVSNASCGNCRVNHLLEWNFPFDSQKSVWFRWPMASKIHGIRNIFIFFSFSFVTEPALHVSHGPPHTHERKIRTDTCNLHIRFNLKSKIVCVAAHTWVLMVKCNCKS